MKKVLFIDRDGTILQEPADEQIDRLEKFRFVPHAITALRHITGLDYELVLASNQDGLGTPAFPAEDFQPLHDLMLQTLAAEDIRFDAQLIDRSLPADEAPTRKPRTGMFGAYQTGDYDLAHSFVIGDRLTDMLLAQNLGTRGILLQSPSAGRQMVEQSGLTDVVCLITDDWLSIADFLNRAERVVHLERITKETQVRVCVDLDGRMPSQVSTGLHFYDHMLQQIVHHAGISLQIQATGDLCVDEHHTMEDVAILLGECIRQALGDKRGIGRYGYALPMDETDAVVLLDLGGRIDFRWDVSFTREYVGDTPTEMFSHVFQSLAQSMQCNLHVRARGVNNHHLAEGIFKAFARALRMAVRREPFDYNLPSSKGML